MSSDNIFKGLGDLYGPKGTGPTNGLQQLKVFPGHVIDICMDAESSLYESPRDIGKIRFRDLVSEYNKEEKDLYKIAYPLDRSILRYPYPGEEVIIYRAFGEVTTPLSLTMANVYFYNTVVSSLHNVSSNQHPFLGTDARHIDSLNIRMSYDKAKTRFDKKTIDINSIKDEENKIKVYKQLQPQEGDFILQGRFGTSIRFGSTSAKAKNEWNSAETTGLPGDGIIVLRTDRDYVSNEKDMFTTENVDKDDSILYLCTSQRLEMSLACSKSMKSWAARYDLPDPESGKEEDGLTSTKDTSQLWQKVIDVEQPVERSFQNPSAEVEVEPSEAPETSNSE